MIITYYKKNGNYSVKFLNEKEEDSRTKPPSHKVSQRIEYLFLIQFKNLIGFSGSLYSLCVSLCLCASARDLNVTFSPE